MADQQAPFARIPDRHEVRAVEPIEDVEPPPSIRRRGNRAVAGVPGEPEIALVAARSKRYPSNSTTPGSACCRTWRSRTLRGAEHRERADRETPALDAGGARRGARCGPARSWRTTAGSAMGGLRAPRRAPVSASDQQPALNKFLNQSLDVARDVSTVAPYTSRQLVDERVDGLSVRQALHDLGAGLVEREHVFGVSASPGALRLRLREHGATASSGELVAASSASGGGVRRRCQ